ncbi:MAG: 30S ribosomal protein S20 [Candidatus Omnitrophota bacterium]|nr:30S ribosomal protein S20 [Candidatus Omnitrophota bacterium]
MPQRKTSIKSMKLDRVRRLHNRVIKTDLKKTIKKYTELVSAKKIDEAKQQLKEVMSKLDRAAKKHLIHKNNASHQKSRYSLLLKKA